jgi:hypothetical protein
MSNRMYLLVYVNSSGYRQPLCVYSTIELARSAKLNHLEEATANDGKLDIQVLDVDVMEGLSVF